MQVMDHSVLREKLKSLRIEHSLLDQQINNADTSGKLNNIEVQRLKKRKLALKDTIVKLESQLIPNLNA